MLYYSTFPSFKVVKISNVHIPVNYSFFLGVLAPYQTSHACRYDSLGITWNYMKDR